jgi:hypothetical protein
VVTAAADDQHRRRVRTTSDALLDDVARLRELEQEKRKVDVSTPRFHELATEITDRSRDIFRRASEEEAEGDAVSGPQGVTLDETSPNQES